jgi:hypothetical protein
VVEVGTQARHTLGMQLVEAASSGLAIGDQPGILEHAEVLGDGWTADRERASELIYGGRAGGELLKDGHAGGIAQGVEAGL